jgi:pimeloyl-ACP methyl ester carboxylesterase
MTFFGPWLLRASAAITGAALIAAGLGAAYELVAQKRAVANFPPPGKMVDIGGRRMQLECIGTGSPTVVFEAGLSMDGALTWALVHESVAGFTRACTYSRAGLMWSDRSSRRHSAMHAAEDLNATLSNAGEKGPFVMVGHSLGGPYGMTYTKYFGEQVAGLVLVDATHPDQVRRMKPVMTEPEPKLLQLAAPLAWTGLLRPLSPSLVPHVPGRHRRDTEAIRAYAPHSLSALMAENDEFDATLAEAGTFRQLGCRPLQVLTAMKPYSADELAVMRITPQQGEQVQAIWRALQEEMASWSFWSEHQLLDRVGHDIQFSDPQVVVEAVRSVVAAVRSNRCDPFFW